ncbi:hypothetical protein GCM10009775_35820 [Microbacterium aoyamense]|uniref:Uncharacterized protein n=1 Tax=Microbacterium aoyamense TaxID=344166 RepID=A0ABP5BCH7_9MICO|nr:hypothetical protein [Microbacterium aoyamense]
MTAEFSDFYLALAGASGAMVGLLFVALTVAREGMLGDEAGEAGRARSGMALACFLIPLVVALFALVPTVKLPVPTLVAGCASLGVVVASARALTSAQPAEASALAKLASVSGFALASLTLFASGILLVVSSDASIAETLVPCALIVLIAAGVHQVWMLVGGQRQGTLRRWIAVMARQRAAKEKEDVAQ